MQMIIQIGIFIRFIDSKKLEGIGWVLTGSKETGILEDGKGVDGSHIHLLPGLFWNYS